jgi:hypothetical protein
MAQLPRFSTDAFPPSEDGSSRLALEILKIGT